MNNLVERLLDVTMELDVPYSNRGPSVRLSILAFREIMRFQ